MENFVFHCIGNKSNHYFCNMTRKQHSQFEVCLLFLPKLKLVSRRHHLAASRPLWFSASMSSYSANQSWSELATAMATNEVCLRYFVQVGKLVSSFGHDFDIDDNLHEFIHAKGLFSFKTTFNRWAIEFCVEKWRYNWILNKMEENLQNRPIFEQPWFRLITSSKWYSKTRSRNELWDKHRLSFAHLTYAPFV